MTDSERIDWLEQHKAVIQHHDYGVVGPWYVTPASDGHSMGKTLREAIDKMVRLMERRERKREQLEAQKKG